MKWPKKYEIAGDEMEFLPVRSEYTSSLCPSENPKKH